MGWPRPLDGQRVHRSAWRSLKYEDVYLKSYADGREAVRGIAERLAFYESITAAPGAGRPYANGRSDAG